MRIRVVFEIDVMQQSRHEPQLRIALKPSRVTCHCRRDHQRMMSLVFVLDVLIEKLLRFGLGREVHGKGQNR